MGMKNVMLGLEIEGVINKDIHRLTIGDYHRGVPTEAKGWKVERDGSIRSENEFSNYDYVEFVSRVLFTRAGVEEKLKVFKDFISQQGKYELHEVISFNKSCGAHIHIGVRNYRFLDKAMVSVFFKVRKKFVKMMSTSNIASKEQIIKHYDRSYARKLRSPFGNYEARWRTDERRTEWNFCSERDNKGLEWRSPNLLGIKTWAEFDEAYRIYLDCLDYLFDLAMNHEFHVSFTEKPEKISKIRDSETCLDIAQISFEEVYQLREVDVVPPLIASQANMLNIHNDSNVLARELSARIRAVQFSNYAAPVVAEDTYYEEEDDGDTTIEDEEDYF